MWETQHSQCNVVYANGLSFLTPTAVPGKPGTPDITGTDKSSVALKWVAPDSDGGSPITNYLVQFRLSGSTQWLLANDTVTVPDTTFSVTGLKEGKEYEFRVAAQNRAGTGEFSAPTKPVKVIKPIGEGHFVVLVSLCPPTPHPLTPLPLSSLSVFYCFRVLSSHWVSCPVHQAYWW